jgi:hypothetical protein
MPEAARRSYQANGLKHYQAYSSAMSDLRQKAHVDPRDKRKKDRQLHGNVEEIYGPRWSSECSYLRQTLVM